MPNFARKPTVFISSTCYDLGLEVLLSEYSSFPIDPSLGIVDNCLRVVQERADIFILIKGKTH